MAEPSGGRCLNFQCIPRCNSSIPRRLDPLASFGSYFIQLDLVKILDHHDNCSHLILLILFGIYQLIATSMHGRTGSSRALSKVNKVSILRGCVCLYWISCLILSIGALPLRAAGRWSAARARSTARRWRADARATPAGVWFRRAPARTPSTTWAHLTIASWCGGRDSKYSKDPL